MARRHAHERSFWKEAAKKRKKALVPRIVRIIEADLMGRWTADRLGQRFDLENKGSDLVLRATVTPSCKALAYPRKQHNDTKKRQRSQKKIL